MKRQAKLTSKGQITIPRDIRRRLGVRAGDKLEFEDNGNGVQVKAVRKESPFAKYMGIGNPGIPRGRKAMLKWLRELRGHTEAMNKALDEIGEANEPFVSAGARRVLERSKW